MLDLGQQRLTIKALQVAVAPADTLEMDYVGTFDPIELDPSNMIS